MADNLAEKLKMLRTERKISMSELSRISGVHQTTISAIESGKHNSPGIDTIEKLANALKVSPLYFFDERIVTPFDLGRAMSKEEVDFLLSADSLPYIKLSKEAYEKGVSSETIKHFLELLQTTGVNKDKQTLKKEAN